MTSVVPAKGSAPLPMETRFISADDRSVRFQDFAVDRTDLQKAHLDFIKNILVPHYINQIESLRFADKVMTVHPVGKASATGASDHNMQLSIARAQNIGFAIKKYFNEQKSRGAFARSVEVKIDAKGEGDRDEREILGANLSKINPKLLEAKSGVFRSVLMSMKLQHLVVDDDTKVVCRQILNMKLKPEKVPSNLLEQKIDELQKSLPPELVAAATELFNAIKTQAKLLVEEILTAAEFSAPELFLLFKTIEFIVPSNIALLFEFKDARGSTQHYNFTGSANKIDLSLIEVVAQLLSFLNWWKKREETLDQLEKRIDDWGRLTKAPLTQLERWKKSIRELKILAGRAKLIFDAHTAPGSILRKAFGDKFVDAIVKAADGASGVLGVQVATEFAPVHFESKGLFDIRSFGGVARTETEERFGMATTVALDFAARANQSLAGFQGHVVMERKFSLTLTLVSHEQSNGVLKPVQRPAL